MRQVLLFSSSSHNTDLHLSHGCDMMRATMAQQRLLCVNLLNVVHQVGFPFEAQPTNQPTTNQNKRATRENIRRMFCCGGLRAIWHAMFFFSCLLPSSPCSYISSFFYLPSLALFPARCNLHYIVIMKQIFKYYIFMYCHRLHLEWRLRMGGKPSS